MSQGSPRATGRLVLHVDVNLTDASPVWSVSQSQSHGGLLPSLLLLLYSVYVVQPNITISEFASEGFTIWTHTTSLTFDLTSDQKPLPNN